MSWQKLFDNPRRPSKGEPTDTNLFTLDRLLTEGGGLIGPRIQASSYPHIKRTLDAGLLEPTGDGRFKLSQKGHRVLAEYRRSWGK